MAFEAPCLHCSVPFRPKHKNQRYCCDECRRISGNDRQNAIRREQGRPELKARPPVVELPPVVKRPVVPLRWNPQIVIGPARPAPVRFYSDSGLPTPFQDDLGAMEDHGSLVMPRLPERGQSRMSVLANL